MHQPIPHILIVDDNPLIIDLFVRLFEQRFTIDGVESASEAMAKIEDNAYDLILIDLILPEMNGLELFRAIRRVRPHQKAMLSTAYEDDARVKQAIAEGAHGCIYKPFQLADMEKVFSSVLDLETSPFEALYEDSELTGSIEFTDKIAIVSHETWSKLFEELSNRPELIYELHPRKFEELVSELLTREGFRVQLTPCSRDKGRDILAFHETAIGRHLFLVECKKFKPSRPVGVTIVRQLYGVITQERATAGLVVSTSRFSHDAISFAESVKHQLELKDYNKVKSWIRSQIGSRGQQPK